MADHDHYNTYVRETRTTEPSGSAMSLIVGGLVVALGFVLWFVFGGNGPVVTAPAGDTTNVTIEPPAAAPADPVIQPEAAAPADDAAAPIEPPVQPPVEE